MESRRRADLPSEKQEVVKLLAVKLEAHLAEFNPVLLKNLEDRGEKEKYLRDRAQEAREAYLEARRSGLSQLGAGELQSQALYPEAETIHATQADFLSSIPK